VAVRIFLIPPAPSPRIFCNVKVKKLIPPVGLIPRGLPRTKWSAMKIDTPLLAAGQFIPEISPDPAPLGLTWHAPAGGV
jgi:hypothetical protein